MREIGIFEAKTHLSRLCEEVARTGAPILVSKRGKPLVTISPPPGDKRSEQPSILEVWKEMKECVPDDAPDFPEVWKEGTTMSMRHPFEDDALGS